MLTALTTNWWNDAQQIPIFVSLCTIVIILINPHRWTKATPGSMKWIIGILFDLLLIIAAVVGAAYIALNYETILWRIGDETKMDIFMGIITALSLFEGTRRSVGIPILVIVAGLAAYTFYGYVLPESIAFFGADLKRVVAETYIGASGIYGIPSKVMFRFVFIFIFFGCMLDISGGSNFFMDMARSLSGRFIGGLAKVAIVSSAFVGAINGSANANVAITGSFTIPAMKERGIRGGGSRCSGGHSINRGQILPPVMGAVAFVMADYVGVTYLQVCKVAVIPALFYYFTIYAVIHFYAKKNNLRGEDPKTLPKVLPSLAKGYFLILSAAALVVGLILGYSPLYCAFFAIIIIIITSFLHKSMRFNFRKIADLFILTARSTCVIGCAGGTAGAIVALFGITGLTSRASDILVGISAGNLPVLLFLTMIASIILGMMASTTVVYILLAVIIAPALVSYGVLKSLLICIYYILAYFR